MTALIRYQAALLVLSQRWLAPVLLYLAFLAVGIRSGQPVLDSLGYTAAGMLPVTAWLVRVCVTQEPPAARAVVAAAAGGQPKAHLAALLTGLGGAALLGTAATVVVLAISDPSSTDHSVRVPLPPAGALCGRPLLHGRGWSIAATALVALLALVTAGSPAKYAVTGLVTGSLTGRVHVPVLPLLGAVAVAAAVFALVCRLTSVRG
ncbi:ABC transporter [Streptomyces sp. NPDC097595]|uniref:ABC transporter n=1 Tax=Streptomyces sp. NPDC097595 TaxID=3366090 RepID=UPI00381D1E5C